MPVHPRRARDQGGHARATGGGDDGQGLLPSGFGLGATLTLAMAVSSFTSFALGALAPFITTDLQLPRVAIGLLTGAFYLVGGLCSPFVGPLVDVLGARRMLHVLFAGGGLALVAMAFAPSYPWLFAGVALAGVSLATGNPATNQLIAALVARGHQGLLVGVKQSGGPMAGLLSGGLLPAGALLVGWRGVLLVSTALAIVGVGATLRFAPSAPRDQRRSPRPRGDVPLGVVVRWLSAYGFLMGGGMAAVTAYLPLYAHERLGLGVGAAGMTVAVIGVAGMVARIVWARRAERMLAAPAPLLALACGSVLALTLIWAAEAGGVWLLWVGAAGFGSSAVAWNAVGMLALIREVDGRVAGRASGMVLLAFYAGLVCSPVAFGLAVDATETYGAGWAVVTTACAGAALVAELWRRRFVDSVVFGPVDAPASDADGAFVHRFARRCRDETTNSPESH